MLDSTKKIGDVGELTAIKYLQSKGYKILDTNFKFGRFGEIDIICEKNSITVFLEVKYRLNEKYGIGEESITKYKLSKLKKTIDFYCVKNSIDFEKIRFDAITILKKEKFFRIKHYKNVEI
ncbi:hypothetical protein CSB07_00210 [Candidatus Gracilibacteria bacterium]|nr:MAG: hypothetical protein CSB07_00210 [Candidatus Gracilibacteria bacterium]PIE85647.1 MAG: hypothetical protein CSA08_00920 [Candidatus Gracilibacteria bacterium]